jgi:hypothetical protein
VSYPEGGRCVRLGVPVNIMVPEIEDPDYAETVELAKTVCATCPFKFECLEDARSNPNTVGVWGGELFELPEENTAETK